MLLWNLALDENHGPHTGGCGDCRGVVTIDSKTGAVTRNDEYYALAHASRFVRPGARRIASTSGNSGGLDTVAFQQQDDGADRAAGGESGQGGARVLGAGERPTASATRLPASGSVATFTWHDAPLNQARHGPAANAVCFCRCVNSAINRRTAVATIKDVARLAGVGLGTASRVVSGKGSVSPATLEKVKKAIDELDFRPSHAARSLLSGSTQMIGVYIPILKGTFYTPILQLIDTELRAAGLHMVVAFGVGPGDERAPGHRRHRVPDGARLRRPDRDEQRTAATKTSPRSAPSSRAWWCSITASPAFREQCFTADHAQGGVLAARALLEHRHRQIAVIAGPSSLARQRRAHRRASWANWSATASTPARCGSPKATSRRKAAGRSARELVASGPQVHGAVLRQRRNGGRRAVVLPAGRHRGAARGVGARLRRHAERRILGAAPDLGAHPVARRDPAAA